MECHSLVSAYIMEKNEDTFGFMLKPFWEGVWKAFLVLLKHREVEKEEEEGKMVLFVGNPYTHFLASDLLPPDGSSFPILPPGQTLKTLPPQSPALVASFSESQEK